MTVSGAVLPDSFHRITPGNPFVNPKYCFSATVYLPDIVLFSVIYFALTDIILNFVSIFPILSDCFPQKGSFSFTSFDKNAEYTKQPLCPLFHKQASGRNAAEIHGLRRLRGRGKSVPRMRECPGPLVGVSRELSGVVRACVETEDTRASG